ncbi:tyrosine-type recombinase/integrase [Bacillus badius]|uniref:tyrosine-type recombinase/integrase n=1 Tax=Bacillus badius TaxID=1455 RepID=UPI002E1EE718|nr:tyrosine-type recombinase/integrase [Bacillus badius]MED0665943.1 tyrosine-type recombinase/integrase [Bacillus badius]
MLLVTVIDELEFHLTVKQRSIETIRGYKLDLLALDRYFVEKTNGPVYVEDLTTEDIESYLETLVMTGKYAVASINRYINSIRVLGQFAYKKGWMETDITKDIESLKGEKKERTYLTEKELIDLFEVIHHPLICLAARTMAFSGLRVSECIHLTLEDVDLENDLIYVIEGKGKKDRTVPISKSLKPYLVDYIDNWRVETTSNRFFATKKTGSLSSQYINRKLHDAVKKLGWKKKVTAHILRHSFASNLVAKDVNIVKVSKLLGHADLKTTSIYTHANHKQLSEAVDLLG